MPDSPDSPPRDKYWFPGVNYPTSNPKDLLIVEEIPVRTSPYHALAYGTPHDKETACVLCWQSPVRGNSVEKPVRRYYANPRLAQEPYNLTNGDDEANSNDHPSFVRSYLYPRNGYTKLTKGTPLTALVKLTLVSPGSGFGAPNRQIALSFTGGSGSGAVGYAEIVGGAVAAVFLTNSGIGFASAPTVSVSGGTGAVITAALQYEGAKLIDEVETPAEEPYGGYFVRVTRTWKTLSGPVVTESVARDRYGNIITTTSQSVPVSAAAAIADDETKIQSYQGIDANYGKLITKNYPAEFAQVTEIEKVDKSVPGSRATVYTYLVDASSTIPDDTATTTYTRAQNPENPDLKIETKTVYGIPSTFNETDGRSWSAPEIFRFALADTVFGTYSNFRPAKSRQVGARVERSFGTTRQDINPTIIEEASWRFPLGFSGHGLTNEEELTFIKSGSTLVLNLPASTPDSDTYDTWVGDEEELLISGGSKIWNAGIYETTKVYAKAI